MGSPGNLSVACMLLMACWHALQSRGRSPAPCLTFAWNQRQLQAVTKALQCTWLYTSLSVWRGLKSIGFAFQLQLRDSEDARRLCMALLCMRLKMERKQVMSVSR